MFSIRGGEDLEDCIRFSGHLSRRYASHSDASSTHPLGRGSPAAFLLGKRTIALESAMSVKRAMLMETTRFLCNGEFNVGRACRVPFPPAFSCRKPVTDWFAQGGLTETAPEGFPASAGPLVADGPMPEGTGCRLAGVPPTSPTVSLRYRGM